MTVSSAMQLSSQGGIKLFRSMVARERARHLRAEGRDIIDLTAALSVPLDRDLAAASRSRVRRNRTSRCCLELKLTNRRTWRAQ
jgi:hypothetical protein